MRWQRTVIAEEDLARFLQRAQHLGYEPGSFSLVSEQSDDALQRTITLQRGRFTCTVDASLRTDWVDGALGALQARMLGQPSPSPEVQARRASLAAGQRPSLRVRVAGTRKAPTDMLHGCAAASAFHALADICAGWAGGPAAVAN